ncbi:MAG: hypothetical protein OEY81_00680 [Candidatus Bathyarchaeota archaeon]|nr:hypothetical protein [Candidatus Bathyarchaeota archaeon]
MSKTFEMTVRKHITREDAEQETVYKVVMQPVKKPSEISTITLSSVDEEIKTQYPLDELVVVTLSKPQKKLM